MTRLIAFSAIVCLVIFSSCKTKQSNFNADDPEILHGNVNRFTEVIIYDVFNPPVASRIYAYTSLAQYEAVRFQDPGAPSFAAKLNGFPAMPTPEQGKKYNFTLAATSAAFTVAQKLIFSRDSLMLYENPLLSNYQDVLDKEVYDNSLAFGEKIGNAILERTTKDNYKETRGMPKYLGSRDDGKWQPTSPDYNEGAEPFWHTIHPFTLDSGSQFRAGAPPKFSKDTNSGFYKMIKEVYLTGVNLTDEQKTIARFWDDNPFVMEHQGHMMFANKKITPGGHWMGITAIACRKTKANPVKTAEAYALTSMALLDAFISCWDNKYHYEYIRPITIINMWIDKKWEPFLQTPSFPEFTSGHSTITSASATVLTRLFGENFSFHDDADKAYIGMERDFPSFAAAASEASVSRLYGGIHFRPALDTGLFRGKMVGIQVLKKLGME